jgi:sulfur carrier protein ThiS adenylyltransferase
MNILVNEVAMEIEDGTPLFALRDQIKPDADVVVLNGAPVAVDQALTEGDHAVFIQRGETPDRETLEALMMARHSPGVHEKVKQATVGIAGLGGLGSAIAVALARIGVGRLILADFDVVEPSNLNRQQYFVDQMGHYKSEALRDNLQRINPYVQVDSHTIMLNPENVPDLFREVDVMVEAFDKAEMKAMIAESFGGHFPKTPLVMASGLAGYEPSNTIETRRVGAHIVMVGDLVSAARQGMGLMAPRVGVAAHHQANAVLRLLLGEEP